MDALNIQPTTQNSHGTYNLLTLRERYFSSLFLLLFKHVFYRRSEEFSFPYPKSSIWCLLDSRKGKWLRAVWVFLLI